MTSRDFVYWLQGFFELSHPGVPVSIEQAACIKRHLALVFAHEIDPSAGDAAHQAKLNDVHTPQPNVAWQRPQVPDGTLLRC